MQRAGFINYHRGYITVLDRSGLEKRACECYQAVKTEFDRLIPDVTVTQAVELRHMRTTSPLRGVRSEPPYHDLLTQTRVLYRCVN